MHKSMRSAATRHIKAMHIATRLAMAVDGINATTLARITNVEYQTISNWLSGRTKSMRMMDEAAVWDWLMSSPVSIIYNDDSTITVSVQIDITVDQPSITGSAVIIAQ